MKLSVINTGLFKLDGGAMFGVVPKSMWNRLNPADDNNLCTWTMRCLLIEDGSRKILIDTGLGSKQDAKFRSHFEPHGVDSIDTSLGNTGINHEDITDVFLTHFHFDHVGGACYYGKNNEILPSFPNAVYWTNEKHYNWALNPNQRERASFLKENFVPLKEMGMYKFIDVEDDVSFTENIRLKFYYGHTEAMMVPFISLPNGKTLVYAADLLPTKHHVKIPYVMAYDVRPLDTIREKAEFYNIVANDDHIIFFEHDKDTECGIITKNEKGRFDLKESGRLIDYLK